MLCFRVIARLDIKGQSVIKGINFEGLRVLGKPQDFARRYADAGADELLYLDTVASLYGRNQLESLIEETASEVFIPITVGGGVQSVEDAQRLLRVGADKIAINTAAVRCPDLISRIADRTGSQAVVVSIEAKKVDGRWEAYTEGGRQKTGLDALEWASTCERLGAGEILLTSIDADGTQKGGDCELVQMAKLSIPAILAGGIASQEHVVQASRFSEAIAIGSALHYGKTTIQTVKKALQEAGKTVRLPPSFKFS